jgi:ribosomal protein S18 acetylase RimI-like enzyme
MSASLVQYSSEFKSLVEEIFFESSTKKEFKDQNERDEFEWKYLGYYLKNYPQYAWIALKEGKVLGYVLGMPQTIDPELYSLQGHLKAFEEHFKSYPAHLHINCHKEARGQGIGKALAQKLLNQMAAEKIPGLHIMTGVTSENRHFYERLGFDFSVTNNTVLFMGIALKSS